jgi:hypothetical protein
MPALSEKTAARIARIIEDHHQALKVETLGPTAVGEGEYKRLVANGTLSKKDLDRNMTAVPAAHTLGVIASQSGDEAVASMTPQAFWRYIDVAPPAMLPHERDAVDASRKKLARCIDDLKHTTLGEFERVQHEENAKLRHEEAISVEKAVTRERGRKDSADTIAARMAKKMGMTKRDWLMAVSTELQNVLTEGKANAILNSVKAGIDPRVFKRPRPDACRFCKLLYLQPNGKTPRVFRLTELVSNGTNEGRRARRPVLRGTNATEWRPTLGVVHPWCQCMLYVLPDGFSFDKEGNMVFVGISKSLDDLAEMTPELRALVDHVCEH